MSDFASLGLIDPLLRALKACGYEQPTPIQTQAIPPLLAGRDVLGCAQTGTGKTAAFALPVLQHLDADPTRGPRRIRALVLSPTRELAAQIGESFDAYAAHLDLRHHVIFGGVGQGAQVNALRRGLDILVACPGRLLDLHNQGYVDLSDVDFFVLDEADRMLDMGFIHDVKRVMQLLPLERQNLLFSATMPSAIVELSHELLDDPVMVEVTPQATTVERIDQKVMFVSKADKRRLLADILHNQGVGQAMVFTRTKHGANRLVEQLDKAGIEAMAIHGNKSQNARTRALDAFRDGRLGVLVATDVASRGIDVDTVTHVINFDLPNEPESYVHRIGRTGRAGRAGTAIAFCDQTEGAYLRDIEKLIGETIPVDLDHPWHADDAVPPRTPARPPGRDGGGNAGGGRRRRGGRQGNLPRPGGGGRRGGGYRGGGRGSGRGGRGRR
ncbi:MAG: DEAD/DEAH box helicase [Alphaproteobacteria bacterium]|nr:DEAD/DEAH box helicase [Alphaproteobacteria bacterium]